jgi:hypothetical protein
MESTRLRWLAFGSVRTKLTLLVIEKVKSLRADGATVPEIMRRTKLSKASVYRATWGSEPSFSGLALLDGLTMGICDECGERLIEIDYYGAPDRLRGMQQVGALWRQQSRSGVEGG